MGKTDRKWIVVLVSIAVMISGIGCTSKSLNVFKDELTTFGPSPLVDRDSFEKIDLVFLLDPNAEKGIDLKNDSLEEQRKKVQKAFDRFYIDPMDQKKRRNRVQERILAASNQRCGEYKNFLKQFESGTNFFLGSLTTAVAGAGAIFTSASTVRALSGTAAILSGVRSEFNEDYFSNQTIQVLTSGFEQKREELYEGILNRRRQGLTNYPVEAAVKDAIVYHASCSLIAGLEQAALAIERIDNPGLKGAQDALVQAKKLQHIMDTPPDQMSTINLSDPIQFYSGTNDALDHMSDLSLEDGLPRAAYASTRAGVAMLKTEFLNVSDSMKKDVYKTKTTQIDAIKTVLDKAIAQTWDVLALKTFESAEDTTIRIQKTKAKIVETLDSGKKGLLTIQLAKQILDGHIIITQIKQIYLECLTNYTVAKDALNNKKEADIDKRIESAKKHINQIRTQMIKTKGTHFLAIVKTKYADLAAADQPALHASLNAIVGGATITDQTTIETLLKTSCGTDLDGFEDKDDAAQTTLSDKAGKIIKALEAAFK